MTSAGNDIQEIGLFIMVLPMMATGGILGFALWQLAMARRVGKASRVRLRVD